MKPKARFNIPIIEAMECRLLMSNDNVLVHTTQTLPSGADAPTAIAVGNKVLFASGLSAAVDIYNTSTGAWSTTNLSKYRTGMSTVVVGNEAMFAGGIYNYFRHRHEYQRNAVVVNIFNARLNRWYVTYLPSATVITNSTSSGDLAVFCNNSDLLIYNTSTEQWTTVSLPESLATPNMVSANGKIILLDDADQNHDAEVYDTSTGIWSTSVISNTILHMAATSVGNLALFAGGSNSEWSNVVDVYNAANGDWSTATLSLARDGIDAAALNNLAIFAGGEGQQITTKTVDIYNSNTGQWSATAMTTPLAYLSSASIGDMELFGGGEEDVLLPLADPHVEIFNTDTMQWSTSLLSQARDTVSTASANGTAFFAGGNFSGDSSGSSNEVDLFTLPEMNVTLSRLMRNQTAITLTNNGTSALPTDTELAVFGSTSGSFDGNSVLLGRVRLTAPLAAGATQTISVPLSIPAGTPAGQYHLITTLGPSHERVQIASTKHTYALDPVPAVANASALFNAGSPINPFPVSGTDGILTSADADESPVLR